MSGREKRNAIISGASLTIRDHDMLTAWLHLDYGAGGQAFGGYVLLTGPNSIRREKGESGPNAAGLFIDRVLRVAGVTSWGELVGKAIKVDADDDKVHGIGHIVRDDWFYPEQEFARLRAGEAA